MFPPTDQVKCIWIPYFISTTDMHGPLLHRAAYQPVPNRLILLAMAWPWGPSNHRASINCQDKHYDKRSTAVSTHRFQPHSFLPALPRCPDPELLHIGKDGRRERCHTCQVFAGREATSLSTDKRMPAASSQLDEADYSSCCFYCRSSLVLEVWPP